MNKMTFFESKKEPMFFGKFHDIKRSLDDGHTMHEIMTGTNEVVGYKRDIDITIQALKNPALSEIPFGPLSLKAVKVSEILAKERLVYMCGELDKVESENLKDYNLYFNTNKESNRKFRFFHGLLRSYATDKINIKKFSEILRYHI